MKILTLNTHSWREEDQESKLEELARTIVDRDYDVIALQEVNQRTTAPYLEENGLRNDNFMVVLLERIKALGGATYYSCWAASKTVRGEFEEGSSLLSKYPLEEIECFTVSLNDDGQDVKNRRIIKATMAFEEQKIDLYSCHMGWWHDEIEPFRPECDKLLERVNTNRLSILMGDFNNNAYIKGEGYDYLIGKGVYDTYELAEKKDKGDTVAGEIAGWKDNEQALRIDLIVLNQPLRVKSSRVIFNGEHKQVVSDHFGVEAEIDL